MAVEPTGSISTRLDAAKTLLATLAAWQTLTDTVGDLPAAKAFIHIGNAPGEAERPLCIVGLRSLLLQRISDGPRDGFDRGNADIGLLIEILLSESDDQDAYIDFTNDLGAVWDDLVEQSGVGGFLSNRSLSVDAIARSDKSQGEPTDYYQGLIVLGSG